MLLSERMAREVKDTFGDRKVNPSINPLSPPGFGGMTIHTSNAFPFDIDCRTCGATGEGYDATYCRKCNGVGKLTVEGAWTQPGGLPLLITNKKTGPKKFMPYFPTGLLPPMRMKGPA